jgi:hypothetical protein
MLPRCFFDGPLGDLKHAAGGPALGHQRQHVVLASGQAGQRAAVRAGRQQVGDDLGIERGAAGRDPGKRVGELGDVDGPVLQQVADPGGPAARAHGQQVGRVPCLDVLGNTRMPTPG